MTAEGAPIRKRRADEGIVALNDLMADAAYEVLLRRSGLDSLDSLFAAREAESLAKPGLDEWRERLRLRIPGGEGETVLYLKRFRRPPASARREVRRAGVGAKSLAGVEWTWLRRVSGDGIACPRAVAFGEECRRGREVRSAVLMTEVPGRSLESLVQDANALAQVDLIELAHRVSRTAAHFHGLGYVHRDFYLSHWFLDPSRDGGGLHLIDLQRVLRPAWWLRRWVVKDLAALNFSTPRTVLGNAARLRWLIKYLDALHGLPYAGVMIPEVDNSRPTKVDPRSRYSSPHAQKEGPHSARGRGCDGQVRKMIYRIVGKTQRIARHHARRTDSLREEAG